MVSVPSPFGASDDGFDAYDEFVPEHLPDPGPFLDGHDVLTGQRHLAVHRLARRLFEERAVYDVTFGYNLARLNGDRHHPDAGYRYAVEDPDAADALGGDDDPREGDAGGLGEDPRVLRAEFTPTTPFCPQSDTLTKGSVRAWNGLAGAHEYDLVRVRVAPMHQRARAINDGLADLETGVRETGQVPRDGDADSGDDRPNGTGAGAGPPF